jgi:hypothetical protein
MRTRNWALLLVLTLLVPALQAEEQQKDPRMAPTQPVSTGDSSSKASKEKATDPVPTAQNLTPDERPLTGVQVFTLGRNDRAHNFLHPRFQISQVADNRGDAALITNEWRTATVVQGGLAFSRVGRNYEFAAGYSGGASIYEGNGGFNESFHAFGFAQSYNWRRWSLLLADEFSYLPETSYFLNGGQFGWLAGTGMAVSGPVASPQIGLSPAVGADQTILTGRARRFMNTAVGQIQHRISARSSFTVAGTYGLLKFREPGFVNSSSAAVRAGYDRSVSARDTLGVMYQVTMFRFDQTNNFNNFDTHQVQLVYGRRLTGRVAWRIAAGPQIARFQNTSALLGDGTIVRFAMETTLTYALRRTTLGLGYTRGANAGSGVYIGADTDTVTFSISRAFTRKWTGGANVGFSRNAALRASADPAGGVTFNTWSTGGELNYRVNRYARLFMNYHMDRQTNNLGGANLPFRHRFGIGLDFGFRPVNLE